jgi:hypothetical protein
LYKFEDFKDILYQPPEVRIVHNIPEPAMSGIGLDPWSLNWDLTSIPGISFADPVDASFHGADASNLLLPGPVNASFPAEDASGLLLPGPEMPGPTFTSPSPSQPDTTFRRSVWQDDVDYELYSLVEPCITEPMKQ